SGPGVTGGNTVTCAEACELIGADPEGASPELLSHLAKCPECQAYREQMLTLNAKIRHALELDWQKVQPTAPPASATPSSAPAAGRPAAPDSARAREPPAAPDSARAPERAAGPQPAT